VYFRGGQREVKDHREEARTRRVKVRGRITATITGGSKLGGVDTYYLITNPQYRILTRHFVGWGGKQGFWGLMGAAVREGKRGAGLPNRDGRPKLRRIKNTGKVQDTTEKIEVEQGKLGWSIKKTVHKQCPPKNPRDSVDRQSDDSIKKKRENAR